MPLVFALLTMLVCAGGIAENIWPGFARLVGDSPDHVTARTEVWGAVYVVAAAVASLAAARFHPGRALARLPLVLVLGSVGVILFLLLLVTGHVVGGAGGDATGGDEAAPGATPAPKNLAAAVLPPDEAERALGVPVEPPGHDRELGDPGRVGVPISGDRPLRLPDARRPRPHLAADPIASVAPRRAGRRRRGVARDRPQRLRERRRLVDRAPLVETAGRILGRLPAGYELDAYERRAGAGSRLRALFAAY